MDGLLIHRHRFTDVVGCVSVLCTQRTSACTRLLDSSISFGASRCELVRLLKLHIMQPEWDSALLNHLSLFPDRHFFFLILTLFLLLFVSSNSVRAVHFPPRDPSGIPTGNLYRILSAAFKWSQPENEIPRARSHTKRMSHQTVCITTQLSALFEQFIAHGAVHKCN